MRQVVSHLQYIDLLNGKMAEHPDYRPAMRAWLHPDGNLQQMGVQYDREVPGQVQVVAWACLQLAETHIVEPPLQA